MKVIENANLDYVKLLSSKMRDHNFMLSYRGNFTQQITKSILAITERKLEIEGTEAATRKKIFNVMVECLQNICRNSHYASSKDKALFMIGKVEGKYVIYSGSLIKNEDVTKLKDKLITINSMSKTELKKFYMNLISNIHLSEVGSAGLGLIDIAKKSGNPLEFDFYKINDSYSFFNLITYVSSL